MVALFLARAGFERRLCLTSFGDGPDPAESAVAQPFLEPTVRLSTVLDILSNGIKTIRSGENKSTFDLTSTE
jgi:hypothetical protein